MNESCLYFVDLFLPLFKQRWKSLQLTENDATHFFFIFVKFQSLNKKNHKADHTCGIKIEQPHTWDRWG